MQSTEESREAVISYGATSSEPMMTNSSVTSYLDECGASGGHALPFPTPPESNAVRTAKTADFHKALIPKRIVDD